jgi:hypothetical protein
MKQKYSKSLLFSVSLISLTMLSACTGLMESVTGERRDHQVVVGARHVPPLNKPGAVPTVNGTVAAVPTVAPEIAPAPVMPQGGAAAVPAPVAAAKPAARVGSYDADPYDYYDASGKQVDPKTLEAKPAPVATPAVVPMTSLAPSAAAPAMVASADHDDNFFGRLLRGTPPASAPVAEVKAPDTPVAKEAAVAPEMPVARMAQDNAAVSPESMSVADLRARGIIVDATKPAPAPEMTPPPAPPAPVVDNAPKAAEADEPWYERILHSSGDTAGGSDTDQWPHERHGLQSGMHTALPVASRRPAEIMGNDDAPPVVPVSEPVQKAAPEPVEAPHADSVAPATDAPQKSAAEAVAPPVPEANAPQDADSDEKPSWFGRMFGEKPVKAPAESGLTLGVPKDAATPALSSVPAIPTEFKEMKSQKQQDLNELQGEHDAAQQQKQLLDVEPSQQPAGMIEIPAPAVPPVPMVTPSDSFNTPAAMTLPEPVAPAASVPAAAPETNAPPVLLGHATAPAASSLKTPNIGPDIGVPVEAEPQGDIFTVTELPTERGPVPAAAATLAPVDKPNDLSAPVSLVAPAPANEMPQGNAAEPSAPVTAGGLPSPTMLETVRMMPSPRYGKDGDVPPPQPAQ